MEESRAIDQLTEALHREVELLEAIAEDEKRLHSLLSNRDWVELERCLSRLNSLSGDVLQAEDRRNTAYERLRSTLEVEEDERFYDVLERLPVEERSELSELYRRLKVAVIQVRSVTGGIDTYVTESTQTMRSVLEELFPEQKGKIYSRSGRSNRADERAIVLDHHM
jgi:hypothetical protein